MRHLPVRLAAVYHSEVVQKRQAGEVVVMSIHGEKSRYLSHRLEYS